MTATVKATVAGLVTMVVAISASAVRADVAPHEHPEAKTAPPITKAVAVLRATAGNNVSGVITFTKVGNGVRVAGKVEGLTPGDHGFHIHEFGDCSAADGTSAGGHFNPAHADHGGPDANVRHVGDLGNLTANENGVANYDRVDTQLAFEGANSILGRGLIVHEKADDLTSQPTGAAGARVACGVIGVTKD